MPQAFVELRVLPGRRADRRGRCRVLGLAARLQGELGSVSGRQGELVLEPVRLLERRDLPGGWPGVAERLADLANGSLTAGPVEVVGPLVLPRVRGLGVTVCRHHADILPADPVNMWRTCRSGP